MTDNQQGWTPSPIPSAIFLGEDGRANINRAPLDRVSGVVYKRSTSTKRVVHEFQAPEADAESPWLGLGEAIEHWLFSEEPDTAERLLSGRRFGFLKVLTLAPESAIPEISERVTDIVLLIIDGQGTLYHRPSAGSPLLTRPLSEGDAVLILAGERYSLGNPKTSDDFRVVVLGLLGTDDAVVADTSG